MIRKSSILITGAGGEVGSELINTLSKNKDVNIVTLDLHPLLSNVSEYVSDQIIGNILDTNIIEQINLEYEIQEIYHLAAILSTRAELSPKIAHDVNINGTVNMLDLGLKQSKSQNTSIKFFFPSSIAVYGIDNRKHCYAEHEALNPMTIYGCNKLYAEKLGLYYSQYYDQLSENNTFIDFRSIRFPGLISSTTTPSGGTSDFIPEMWHGIRNTNKYECFVNQDTSLPFLAMPDAINGIIKQMNEELVNIKSKIYNVTAFSSSVLEFFNKIKLYNNQASISYNIHPIRQNIVDSWPSSIDDSCAKKEWGWNPEFNLNNIFDNYLIQ